MTRAVGRIFRQWKPARHSDNGRAGNNRGGENVARSAHDGNTLLSNVMAAIIPGLYRSCVDR